MDKLKGKSLSLPEVTKESIPERLRELIGKRSVRAAAKDWGVVFFYFKQLPDARY